MTPLSFEPWARILVPLVAQVTVWLAAGAVVATLAARRGPRAAAETTTAVLAGVLMLTGLALAPWPSWGAWMPTHSDKDPYEPPPDISGTEPDLPAGWISLGEQVPRDEGEFEPGVWQSGVGPWACVAVAVVLPVLAGWGLLRLGLGLVAVRRCLAQKPARVRPGTPRPLRGPPADHGRAASCPPPRTARPGHSRDSWLRPARDLPAGRSGVLGPGGDD